MRLIIAGRITKYHIETVNGEAVMVVDDMEVDWHKVLRERDPDYAKALNEVQPPKKEQRGKDYL